MSTAQSLRQSVLRGKHIEIADYNGSGCKFTACAFSDNGRYLSHPQVIITLGVSVRTLNLTSKTTDESLSDFVVCSIEQLTSEAQS